MTDEVKIAPNLYATVGKRRTTFYTRLEGKRISLGHDEQQAKDICSRHNGWGS